MSGDMCGGAAGGGMRGEMGLLTGAPPDFVTVAGVRYAVHTTHRNWIRFDSLMSDPDCPAPDKLIGALRLCYVRRLPPDAAAALDAAVGFYLCGDERPARGGALGSAQRRAYSFAHDAKYIYAAFL